MFQNRWKVAMVFPMFVSMLAIAGEPADSQKYCSYVVEQALAQRDLLRTPIGFIGTTQPETGLPMQVVGGASLGLSNVKKASLAMDVARKNCALYTSTLGAQESTQYATAYLEKDALQHRLTLIEQASKSLDGLIEKTAEMVKAQNATRVMLFNLQTTKIKLDADRADTQSKISALYTPPLSDTPLKDLVSEKQRREEEEQKSLGRFSRQNNWDVALSVGIHQQVNPIAQGAQPYGAVSINYNFASRTIDRHLDNAAESYTEWKKVQDSDVVRSMEILRQQLQSSISVQQAKLKSLQQESVEISQNLQILGEPDTSAAFDYQNQLTAAQLLLQVEIGDANFRIQSFQVYLARNY
jgi:hypothetical protein